MKKITFLTLLVVFAGLLLMAPANLSAQNYTAAGNLLINGGSTLNPYTLHESETKEVDGDKIETEYSGYDFDLSFQYFIIDSLAIGATADYSDTTSVRKLNSVTQSDNDAKEYTIGPIIGYHIAGLGKIVPYIYGSYLFGKNKNENNLSTWENEYDLSGFAIGIGLSYYFNDFFGMYIEVSYKNMSGEISSSTTSQDEDYESKQTLVGVGFQGLINLN